MFKCFLCEYQFEVSGHLLIHLNIYHDIKSIKIFECKQLNCFRSFGSLDSFKKHISSHTFVTNNIINQQINVDKQSSSIKNNIDINIISEETTEIQCHLELTSFFTLENFKNNLKKIQLTWSQNGIVTVQYPGIWFKSF